MRPLAYAVAGVAAVVYLLGFVDDLGNLVVALAAGGALLTAAATLPHRGRMLIPGCLLTVVTALVLAQGVVQSPFVSLVTVAALVLALVAGGLAVAAVLIDTGVLAVPARPRRPAQAGPPVAQPGPGPDVRGGPVPPYRAPWSEQPTAFVPAQQRPDTGRAEWYAGAPSDPSGGFAAASSDQTVVRPETGPNPVGDQGERQRSEWAPPVRPTAGAPEERPLGERPPTARAAMSGAPTGDVPLGGLRSGGVPPGAPTGSVPLGGGAPSGGPGGGVPPGASTGGVPLGGPGGPSTGGVPLGGMATGIGPSSGPSGGVPPAAPTGGTPVGGVPTGNVPTARAATEIAPTVQPPADAPDPGGRHAAPDQQRTGVPPEGGAPIPRSEPTVVSPLTTEPDAEEERRPPQVHP